MFQSYQFMQINPDITMAFVETDLDLNAFQSYQFMQINPDTAISLVDFIAHSLVSIVSIHADQSRHLKNQKPAEFLPHVSIVSIHADQSRLVLFFTYVFTIHRFQSYQFMQINPDQVQQAPVANQQSSFNRINSCRSIPTCFSAVLWFQLTTFQSYQFMQINPDDICVCLYASLFGGFNRINSCRSIPTRSIWLSVRRNGLWVSIVSIHADQSRRNFCKSLLIQWLCFNRINSCRSIPT